MQKCQNSFEAHAISGTSNTFSVKTYINIKYLKINCICQKNGPSILFSRPSGHIAFFDSSGGMDRSDIRLFLMVTSTEGGAMPLGTFIAFNCIGRTELSHIIQSFMPWQGVI